MCCKQNIRLSLRMFSMITGINESKTLSKHILCECKCKFDGRECNSNQKWKNNECWCDCKNLEKYRVSKKDYILNPATCSWENCKYFEGITDNLVIVCDEIIDVEAKSYIKETKTVTTDVNE